MVAKETQKQKVLNYCGKKFGKITILSPTDEFNGKNRIYECKCDCGNVVYCLIGNLTSGNTKSCGCLRKELISKRNRIDLTGKIFGKLKVIKSIGVHPTKRQQIWLCKCECGNEVNVLGGYLTCKTSRTRSCGCLRKETAKKYHKNLHGQIFGRLLVIDKVGSNNRWRVIWLCECDCGEITVVTGDHLRSGHTKSCGCLQKENTSKSRVLSLEGYKFGKLFVLEKYGIIEGCMNWRCLCDCGKEKIISGNSLMTGKTQSCGCQMIAKINSARLWAGVGEYSSFDKLKEEIHERRKNLGNRS